MQTSLELKFFPTLQNQKSKNSAHITTHLQKSFALINNPNCLLTPRNQRILPSIRLISIRQGL
jgi:hypothetical protein